MCLIKKILKVKLKNLWTIDIDFVMPFSLSNVALNIRTINAMIDDADLPVEFVDGHIQVSFAFPEMC